MRRIPAILLSLLLVAAACGDDDGSLFSEDSPPTTEAAGDDGATPSTTAPRDETTTSSPAGNGGDGASGDDIEALLEEYRSTPLRLVYRLDGVGGGEIMILAQDPTRTPPVSSFSSPDENSRVIQRGDEMTICDDEACFSVPGAGGEQMLMGMFGTAMVGALMTGGIGDVPGLDVDTGTETIAGRTGLCFTYNPSQSFDPTVEFARQCVDAELGFTLLVESRERGSDQVETVMELLEFGRPTDEDFEPTGPVTGMPES